MYIAKRKSTNKWINDFQDSVKPETLISNAVKAGIPSNDIEVVDVTKKEFVNIVATELQAARVALEQENVLTQTELRNIGQAVMTKLALTKAQMKKFILFMRQIDVDSF